LQRDVGATLDVGRAAALVIERLAVDRDAHQVQPNAFSGLSSRVSGVIWTPS
jgi:hypothetical protein